MIKPDSLRAALTAAVPALTVNPDRLKIFIDKGTVATRGTEQLGFEYRYRLHAELLDFPASAPEGVFVALVLWLREHQPDLLQNHARGNAAINFDAEIVNAETIDLIFELDLTEAIAVAPREGGGFDVVHLTEPKIPHFDPEDPAGAVLDQLWLRDQLIFDSTSQ